MNDIDLENSFEKYHNGEHKFDSDLLDFDEFLDVEDAQEKLEDDKFLGMVSMIESIFAGNETDAFKVYAITQLLISQCEDKSEMNNISQLFLFREVARERISKDEKKD